MMNFNDACFRFSQELARSFMLSSSRHPFLSQLFRRTGGNMLLLQSERALMFVPWLFLTWMFCALLRIFKVTGAEGETRTLRVASPQTCSSFNWTFQREVASSLQECVCLASLLGLFESAKLEHSPWIVLRCDGPPTGTVSEEPLKV